MVEMGRLNDFIELLTSITKGFLDNNIALDFLLDIGRFYGCQYTTSRMRYDEHTLMFWAVFYKKFSG